MRFDVVLAERCGFTRNKAQQLIALGLVSVNGKTITKTSFDVSESDTFAIIEDRRVYWVSRSAEKLIGFLEQSRNEMLLQKVAGSSCLDVGSSTGGFTQVLLEHGAAHVDAVDVGTNQLHETIRNDARVTSYEEMDIRHFANQDRMRYDFIVCDASFISLVEILDSMLALADKETNIILLFKPQFEVGKQHLRKTGVPKDEKSIQDAMKRFENFVQNS